MATNKIIKKTERGLGTSDTKTLEEIFCTIEDFDPNAMMQALLDGVQSENPEFGAVSMDYADSPNIENFVPNPSTTKTAGDTNPNNQQPAPSAWPPPASGAGSQEQPKDTSAQTAAQKVDSLIPGKSS